MKERPIIFSTPMVQALQDGRKTQSRRLVKGTALEWLAPDMFTPEFVADQANQLCSYGQPGDLLWVRETHYLHVDYLNGHNDEYLQPGENCYYQAEHDWSQLGFIKAWYKKRPSIFMPKAAARVWLRITDIRVERLLDISGEDAEKEGIEKLENGFWKCYDPDINDGEGSCPMASISFVTLWASIHGPQAYNENPWVWVLEFEKIDR